MAGCNQIGCCCDECDIPVDTVDATSAYTVSDLSLVTVGGGCNCNASAQPLASGVVAHSGTNAWTYIEGAGFASLAGKYLLLLDVSLVIPGGDDCPYWKLRATCLTADEGVSCIWQGKKTTGLTAAGVYTYDAAICEASTGCQTGVPATLTVS